MAGGRLWSSCTPKSTSKSVTKIIMPFYCSTQTLAILLDSDGSNVTSIGKTSTFSRSFIQLLQNGDNISTLERILIFFPLLVEYGITADCFTKHIMTKLCDEFRFYILHN